jgi:hypothetical protein
MNRMIQMRQDSDAQHSNNSSSSFGVGLAIGLGSNGGFAGVNVNAAGSRGNSDGTSEVLASLDSTVLTGKDSSNSLNKNWDGQQLQEEVTAQAQVMQAFSQQASKAIGDYAGSQRDDLLKQAEKADLNGDSTQAEQLRADAAKWDEGGEYRVALHTATGALTGGVGGALGAAVSSAAMPEIAQAIKDLGLPEEVTKGLEQVTATALGAVVGGTAGATSGLTVEANNRQLAHTEREWAKQNAKKYQQFLEERTGEKISDEEAYQRLLSAGYAIVDAAAEIGGKSDESAKQFIGLNKTKGLFVASSTERANASLNGNPDGSWTPEQQARFGAKNPTDWANKQVANANLVVGKSCEDAYACSTKVNSILSAVEALEQKKVLYQDDPVQRQKIEAQQSMLLNGMTTADVERAKLAQADQSTLLEMLGMAGGPALAANLAKSLAKLGGANGEAVAVDAGSVKGGNPTGSTQNCTNCVAVVDNLLTTGNPASALPRATPVPFDQLGKMYGTKFSGWTTQQNIESTLLAGGDGTRAVIYGTDGATGHVWNAVVQNGKVNYIDGQIGSGGASNFKAFTNFQFGVLP